MVATKSGVKVRKPKQQIPEYLIYELIDGKPIHYKGYQEVLAGDKTFSEIMGSSSLQSFIITYLVLSIGKVIDEDLYTLLTSEAGIHLSKNTNLAGDILIFDAKTFTIDDIDEHYVQTPPKIVLEIDITADPSDIDPDNYIHQKTQKLLDFGVEKVIWITTKTKKVIVATQGEDWQIKDWHKEVMVMDGISFNIGQYLKNKGSAFA
jgi:Uma2 family endonuclease